MNPLPTTALGTESLRIALNLMRADARTLYMLACEQEAKYKAAPWFLKWFYLIDLRSWRNHYLELYKQIERGEEQLKESEGFIVKGEDLAKQFSNK